MHYFKVGREKVHFLKEAYCSHPQSVEMLYLGPGVVQCSSTPSTLVCGSPGDTYYLELTQVRCLDLTRGAWD